MAMDVLVSVALDEVCAILSAGLPVTGLWTALSGEFEAAGLPLDLAVKSALFARLIALPHISLMERKPGENTGKQGKPDDTLVHSAAKTVEAAERHGALLFASPALSDNFLGIYDHRYSASKLSAKQKETLERVGASRTSGVTQKSLWESIGMETKESIGMEPNQSIDMKPSKSIRMKANNFHYVVKTLQSQGLIVGKQAIVKSNDVGGETEYDSRDSLIVSTNLLYLSRYAKELNMNSYQRIEIAKPKLGRDEEINIDALQEDDNLIVDYKSYVSIHDYLPAMKAICDKLEEASGKVLAVSYKKGPQLQDATWAQGMEKYAQLVEEIGAKVDDEVIRCLRLLKKFNPNEFKRESTTSNFKLGNKCLVTDQLMELPLENSIYDMIHAQGPKGATLVEICRCLGGKYNPKVLIRRVSSMLEKFNLTSQAEVVGKTKQYRYWTLENFSLYKANTALQNCDALRDHDYCPNLRSSVPSKESDSLSPQGDSCVNNKVLFQEDCRDTTVVHHLLSNHEASVGVSQPVGQGGRYPSYGCTESSDMQDLAGKADS